MTTPSGVLSNYTTSTTPEEIKAQQEERKKRETSLDIIKRYARSNEIQQRFQNMLGSHSGRNYVESVIISVTNNEKLQKCTPKSIMVSAMRAASLKLSVDPALSQAHLVPFGNECTFIPDYHGLVQLSTQTGMYIDPPVCSEVFEGEEVHVDRYSQRVTITGKPISKEEGTGYGWLFYFKDINGVERFLFMTNEECDAHGKKYNPGGFASKDSPWNDHGGRNRWKMRRKTCLRIGIKQWGYFSPAMKQVVFEEDDTEVLDGMYSDVPDVDQVQLAPKAESQSQEKNISDLGFNPDPVKNETWESWLKLVARAKKVKVSVADIQREGYTESDLKAAFDELQRFVLDAEDQEAVQ